MSKKLIKIVAIIISILLIISLIDSLNHNYSDAAEESDLIVMIGGDSGRLKKAAELYKEGYADFVMITPVINSSRTEQNLSTAMTYGISKEALVADYEAESTYSNAVITIEYMEENNMTSALIVTSDYHIKRTKYIYEKENDGDLQFKYISALSKTDGRWYESSASFYIWYSEYFKLNWYRLGLYKFTG